jgi:hypothetical protein
LDREEGKLLRKQDIQRSKGTEEMYDRNEEGDAKSEIDKLCIWGTLDGNEEVQKAIENEGDIRIQEEGDRSVKTSDDQRK